LTVVTFSEKNLTVAVGAENANRDFDWLAGLAAPAHP